MAELLLQRSRAVTVAKVYEALFSRWPTARQLAAVPEAAIAEIIRPLGLTRRARTLKALAEAVAARGEVPSRLDQLTTLPGIGRYAASATSAVAFNRHVGTVDGVSARVYRRYFGLPGDAPPVADTRLWQLVEEVTPRGPVREWNWAVLDLAAGICLPKIPRCAECPLLGACLYSLEAPESVVGNP